MKEIKITAVGLAAAVSASAWGQEFTDRGAFEAAAGSVTVESFEDEPLSGSAGSGAVIGMMFDDFSIETSPAAAKLVDVPLFGSFNTTPDGKNYLYLDTDRGFVGSRTTYTFIEPVTAFGFDYTGMGERDNEFTVEIDGRTFVVDSGPTITDGFWGYVGGPVTTIVVQSTTDSGYGIDEVATSGGAHAEQTLMAMGR